MAKISFIALPSMSHTHTHTHTTHPILRKINALLYSKEVKLYTQ